MRCRGTRLGSTWTDFAPVKEAWEEAFRDKPYTTHALAIAGVHSAPCPSEAETHPETMPLYSMQASLVQCSLNACLGCHFRMLCRDTWHQCKDTGQLSGMSTVMLCCAQGTR